VGLPAFFINLRFPDQQFDAEAGTHYNYFRDYEPASGRYIQSDPIRMRGGIASFSYGYSEPLFDRDIYETVPKICVSRSRHPKSADHVERAQSAGQPKEVTIARPGAPDNRRESLAGIDTLSGYNRDEYPPAMFAEGGAGASVEYVLAANNRGSGSCLGHQCRGLPDDMKVLIEIVD